MQESRNTKKVLAQLYPRQATKRMQQAAMIAKAEIEFIKYVHGEASEEYLDILIETGKLFLQVQPQVRKVTEASCKVLKEAVSHHLFEEKKDAEQKAQLIVLVAMSSILSGEVEQAMEYIFKGIELCKQSFDRSCVQTGRCQAGPGRCQAGSASPIPTKLYVFHSVFGHRRQS